MAGGGSRLRGCLAMVWGPREFYLAVAVAVWLGGYFVADGWEQRRAFRWLVPFFLLTGDVLVRTLREVRWLWLVGALLGFQAVSRWWTEGAGTPVSNAADAVAVFLLTVGLVAIGRRELGGTAVIGFLTVLASVVTLASLLAFYAGAENDLAGDRLRNVFIYTEGDFPGLNAVLTGMLCGFGAVGAAWFGRNGDWPLRRSFFLGCLAVLVFGLMASQSRGAMLAAVAGFGVLVFFVRRALWPALATTAAAVAGYFLVTMRTDTAAELIERGSTGRLDIYRWFLERMTVRDGFIGRGMAADVTIAEKDFGWLVHHPHSAYLTQFVLTGLVGLGLLLAVIGWAARRALREAERKDALWLALIASGAIAVLFDCGQIFTLHSAPRIEYLLVVVPAALATGRTREDNYPS